VLFLLCYDCIIFVVSGLYVFYLRVIQYFEDMIILLKYEIIGAQFTLISISKV